MTITIEIEAMCSESKLPDWDKFCTEILLRMSPLYTLGVICQTANIGCKLTKAEKKRYHQK